MKKVIAFLVFILVTGGFGYGLWQVYQYAQPKTEEVKLFPKINQEVAVNPPVIEPIKEEVKEPVMCAQVVTYARAKDSTTCEMYPTPCDVPSGYIVCETPTVTEPQKPEEIPQANPVVVETAPSIPEPGNALAYFQKPEVNPNCEAVFELERSVPVLQQTQDEMIQAALALLRPLTAEEIGKGFETSIPEGTKLKKLWVSNGTATVDFSKELNVGGGSCLMESRRSQIESTLKQFPEVRSVVISVEGNSETALQP